MVSQERRVRHRASRSPAPARGPIVVREPTRLAYLVSKICTVDPELGGLPLLGCGVEGAR